jgi:amino-acid N-acetyltransferase
MPENIRDFSAYLDNTLARCTALHFFAPTTAEVRSLAVKPEFKRPGIGRALVEESRRIGANELESIFAFRYVPGWFFFAIGFW